MRLRTSAHKSDELTLTWSDLFWLALGRALCVSALNVRREGGTGLRMVNITGVDGVSRRIKVQ